MLQGPRVLVIDDNDDSRDLYELALQAEGCDVRGAHDVDEALGILVEWSADVVVTDLMMPGKDGFDFVRALRAAGRTMPALLLSGRTGPEHSARAVAEGFQESLAKPCEPDHLAARVKWWAGRNVEGA